MRMPGSDATVGLSLPISEIKAELFKALGHPARVRILEVLSQGEHAVGEMQPLVGIEASHLSQQLSVLRKARLVRSRKDRSSVIYSVADPEIMELLAVAKRILLASLSSNVDLIADLRAAADR